MTAEEYYDMQALRSQVNTLIMENGMLKNRCLELERRLKECEDERKEIIQEDTEEKIPPPPPSIHSGGERFRFSYFRGEGHLPRWKDKGVENGTGLR